MIKSNAARAVVSLFDRTYVQPLSYQNSQADWDLTSHWISDHFNVRTAIDYVLIFMWFFRENYNLRLGEKTETVQLSTHVEMGTLITFPFAEYRCYWVSQKLPNFFE